MRRPQGAGEPLEVAPVRSGNDRHRTSRRGVAADGSGDRADQDQVDLVRSEPAQYGNPLLVEMLELLGRVGGGRVDPRRTMSKQHAARFAPGSRTPSRLFTQRSQAQTGSASICASLRSSPGASRESASITFASGVTAATGASVAIASHERRGDLLGGEVAALVEASHPLTDCSCSPPARPTQRVVRVMLVATIPGHTAVTPMP